MKPWILFAILVLLSTIGTIVSYNEAWYPLSLIGAFLCGCTTIISFVEYTGR